MDSGLENSDGSKAEERMQVLLMHNNNQTTEKESSRFFKVLRFQIWIVLENRCVLVFYIEPFMILPEGQPKKEFRTVKVLNRSDSVGATMLFAKTWVALYVVLLLLLIILP